MKFTESPLPGWAHSKLTLRRVGDGLAISATFS